MHSAGILQRERQRDTHTHTERQKETGISATVCFSRQYIFEITVFEATPSWQSASLFISHFNTIKLKNRINNLNRNKAEQAHRH